MENKLEDKQVRTSLGPRVREPVREFYASMFENQTAGSEFALEAFRFIIRRALAELTGKFSEQELILILDVANGLALSSEQFGAHILIDVADAIQFESADKKHTTDGKALLMKLGTLSTIQLGALGIWAKAFWIQFAKRDKSKKFITLNQYVAPLVAPEGHD